jgi:hypothetical protein
MTRLIDRYEAELLEAARALERPAGGRPARSGWRVTGYGAAAVALVALLAVVAAISLLVASGGRTPDRPVTTVPAGLYEGAMAIGRHPLPKGAPHGSALTLAHDGGYGLTIGVHRLTGTYTADGDAISFGGRGRYEYLPGLRTRLAPLPDAAGRCRGALGSYRVRRTGDTLRLVLLSDRCGPRARALTAGPWVRRGG